MFARIALIGAALAVAAPAAAATLLTDPTGYTGAVLDLSGFESTFTFTAGPVALGGGVTFQSTSEFSAIGRGFYGLVDNGNTLNSVIVGTNSGNATVTLTFDAPVSAFGGGMTYARVSGVPVVANPVISAFDVDGDLIASYDLAVLAPINTPGAVDALRFRAIDGEGQLIKSFTLSGSFLVLANVLGDGDVDVPAPASLTVLLGGLALLGAARRRG